MKSQASKTMTPLVMKVLSKILSKEKTKLLLAVSGGQDSSVMLHFFQNLSKIEPSFEIVAAHFDHGLRDGSAQDLEFVKAAAAAIDIEFVSGRAELFDGKSNMESWAREHRYAFLESQRKKHNCNFIATAHHMRDQSETLLMRFLNGRFATSPYGIAEIDKSRLLLRPMLFCSKELIEAYAEQHKVSFALDPTNAETKITRNWIRQELLPLIESELNPSFDTTMSYTAERFALDEAFLMSSAQEVFDAKGRECSNVLFLREQAEAIRWRLLSLIAQEHCGIEAGVVGYLPLKRLSRSIYGLETYETKVVELGSAWACKYSMKGNVKFFRHC